MDIAKQPFVDDFPTINCNFSYSRSCLPKGKTLISIANHGFKISPASQMLCHKTFHRKGACRQVLDFPRKSAPGNFQQPKCKTNKTYKGHTLIKLETFVRILLCCKPTYLPIRSFVGHVRRYVSTSKRPGSRSWKGNWPKSAKYKTTWHGEGQMWVFSIFFQRSKLKTWKHAVGTMLEPCKLQISMLWCPEMQHSRNASQHCTTVEHGLKKREQDAVCYKSLSSSYSSCPNIDAEGVVMKPHLWLAWLRLVVPFWICCPDTSKK